MFLGWRPQPHPMPAWESSKRICYLFQKKSWLQIPFLRAFTSEIVNSFSVWDALHLFQTRHVCLSQESERHPLEILSSVWNSCPRFLSSSLCKRVGTNFNKHWLAGTKPYQIEQSHTCFLQFSNFLSLSPVHSPSISPIPFKCPVTSIKIGVELSSPEGSFSY